MGFFRYKPGPFERESGEADAIAKRSKAESHTMFRGDVDFLDEKYPGVAGSPSHPQYKAYWNEYNEAWNRMGARNREISEAHGQTIGTLQMKHFPDAVRSGRAWSPDPALNQFGNRNLQPMQFGE